MLALCLGAWLWLRVGLGALVHEYMRGRCRWFIRGFWQEAHDVRLWIEQRRFEKHCADGTFGYEPAML